MPASSRTPREEKFQRNFNVVFLIFAVFIIYFLLGNDKEDSALDSVRLEFIWDKDASGVIMFADFIVYNDSDQDIKDIKIECAHYAKSGTQLDNNTRIIYEIVKAKSGESFEEFNMGFIHDQATSTSCRIIGLKVA